MRKVIVVIFAFIVCSGWTASSFAQRTFWIPEHEKAFAIELSLQNTDLKRLPMYRNSIRSLAVSGDHIIGGTAAKEGLSPYVFVASLSQREVISTKDLATALSGQRSIQSGFCEAGDNTLFAGTIANKNADEGGHLIRINVSENGAIEISDLGVPVSGEGIFSLTCNADGTVIYGVSYPSGLFFTYDINSGETQTFDDVAPTEEELDLFGNYEQEPKDYLAEALVVDNQGKVYGSTGLNKIFYFDPETQNFQIIGDKIPEVWGRTSLGQVTSWAKTDDGILYGGNAGEGQLFRLDPSTNQITNLGKPIMMNGLPGLAMGADGKLYGIAGRPPGYAHLFSYEPDGEGFRDYGNPRFPMVAPGIEQGINWRAYNIGALTSSKDGEYIVMGEDEALSQLLIFAVENQ